MRKLILQEFVTLNGLASGPSGSVDFVPASMRGDQRFGREQLALIETVDTMLLGRLTYLMFSRHWPNVIEGEEKTFADRLNALQKVVFSQTLDRAPWGEWGDGRIARASPADEVSRLKRQPGGHIIVWGSLSLAQTLISAGLVDEYRVIVCPVALPGGRPLFGETVTPLQMTLIDAHPLDRGAVSLTYTQTTRPRENSI